MPSQVIGRVQPVNQGNYDATRAYVVLDRVKYQGAWYECQADAAVGVAPEAGGNAYWMEIGGRGADGLTPSPVWSGTELHFEYSDGTTTSAVDLQGPQGIQGVQGPPGQTPPLTSDLTSTAPDVALSALGGNKLAGNMLPVGSIIWSASSTVPAGYLLCNGSAVGRATYPELFAAIGTTYGEGDGSTTFNLPDLIGRFIEGASTAGTVKAAGLPNITGQSALIPLQSGTDVDQKTGAIRTVGSGNSSTGGTGTKTGYIYFDAADSSSVYGNSTTVQPPAVTALPCIKAFSSVVGDATVVAGQLINEIQSKVALDGSNTASIGGTLSTYMAHAAMPSGQYIELALPANGTVLTAPADGYVAFEMRGLTGQYIGLWARDPADISVDYYASCCILAANNVARAFIPISKGQNYAVGYTATGAFSYLRFIYANGSAPTNP